MSDKHKRRLAITTGDINGVGIEIILKTFLDQRLLDICTPVIYGNVRLISWYRKQLNLGNINITNPATVDQLTPKTLNVLNTWNEDAVCEPGKQTDGSAKYARLSLDAAIADVLAAKADALITAPVNKKTMKSDSFPFIGQTEYLASKSSVPSALMFMVSESLRVGTVTNHIPVKDISSKLTKESIVGKLNAMKNSLAIDFGIDNPRIAVLSLNPHSGDSGLIGGEEIAIISPAIQEAKQQGMYCFGPYAADGFFGSGKQKTFDAVLAMYHDQGLIPFKQMSFGSGVNFTAGLPFVRTSPDHGTAFDIAGKGVADEESFRMAVLTALDILDARADHADRFSNPVKKVAVSKELS